MNINNLSITRIVSFSLVLVLLVTLGSFGTYNYMRQKSKAAQMLQAEGKNAAGRFAFNLISALWNLDKGQAIDVIKSEMNNRNILSVQVFNNKGDLFAGMKRDENWKAVKLNEKKDFDNAEINYKNDIMRKDSEVGSVQVFLTDKFVQKELEDVMYMTITSFLVIGAVILGVLFWLIRSLLIKPILLIRDYAEKVGEGDLDVSPPEGKFMGELHILKEAQTSMVDNLKNKISEVEAKEAEANELTEKTKTALADAEEARNKAENAKREGMLEAASRLTEIVERISSASEELSAQIEESSSGSDNQRNNAGEVATAMEEMNASVLEIAKNASGAAEGSDKAQNKAEEGADIVSSAVKSINEVNEKSRQMQSSLQDLGKKANNIGEVMNVINDIADQTNLLALNAAIEAARAGEAGRGFAVVADEVRKLAEKTMSATKEVGEAVDSIQQGTETNITDMNETGKLVEKSTSLSNNAGDSLREIVQMVQENTDQVRNIATASEEQSAASEQINASTEEISRIASEVADSMQQSAQAISELAALSGDLQNIIKKMREE